MAPRALTFYQLLGVGRTASADEIRHAYRRLAQKYHPDKYRGRGDAAAVMAQLNRAYTVLSDEAQRAAYDRDIEAFTQGSSERPVVPLVPLGIGGWPWLVLSATLCLILLVVGFIGLKTLAPQRATYVPGPAASAPAVAEPVNPVAASTVQPWQEPPPRAVPLANDPVARLVRDGVLPSTPARPAP